MAGLAFNRARLNPPNLLREEAQSCTSTGSSVTGHSFELILDDLKDRRCREPPFSAVFQANFSSTSNVVCLPPQSERS